LADKKSISIGGGGFSLSLLFAAIGYFVYGGPNGAVAIFILSIVLAMTSLLGLIPAVGPILYAVLSYKWIIPKVLSLAEISGSKLTGFIFVFYLVMSVIYTIIVGIALE
jgi:hypothetical protein